MESAVSKALNLLNNVLNSGSDLMGGPF
jgi:hypothetical protein